MYELELSISAVAMDIVREFLTTALRTVSRIRPSQNIPRIIVVISKDLCFY